MFPGEIDFLKLLEGGRTDFLSGLFELITMLGEETLLVVFLATVYFMFDKDMAHRLFFITISSMTINNIVKLIAQVPRPFADGKITTVREETATGYSFPSGHTQTISTWSTALAIQYKKPWLIAFAAVAIPAVAFSRLYLGVHYPSDVVAGAILGIGFAFLFSYLYDLFEDKIKLYTIVLVAVTPFAIGFMFMGDPLSDDFYKIYGMLVGGYLGAIFEKRYVNFGYDVPIWKRLIRVAVGIGAALLIKVGLNFADLVPIVQISLLLDALRYFVLIFVVMGLLPWAFKKFNF